MNLLTQPKRVFFDVNIGTDPSAATALLFALRHSDIQVVGISINGKNQDRRKQEAEDLLAEVGQNDVPVFLGEQVSRLVVDATMPEHTVVIGPLTNIAKLVLDETTLGHVHISGGVFRTIHSRGQTHTVEKNFADDLDSARIVLTQLNDITLSAFDASSQLILDAQTRATIETAQPFLAPRFLGYEQFLTNKYSIEYSNIVLADILPICDVLDTPTVTREIIEFVFQEDGSLYSTTPLDNCPDPIEQMKKSSAEIATPVVKHQVIRTVNAERILAELTNTL